MPRETKPRKKGEGSRGSINVRMDNDLINRLIAVAKDWGIEDVSGMVRMIIKQNIQDYEKGGRRDSLPEQKP